MQKLINEMLSIGLLIDNPVLDSNIHRVGTSNKPKSKNGWYSGIIIHDKIYCSFGRWDTGQKFKYNNNGSCNISNDDQAILDMIRDRIEQEKQERYKKAAAQAVKYWNNSIEVITHAYLEKKQVKSHIARLYKDILLIPIFNSAGQLVNLQRIYENGDKKFLFGGEIPGCAAAIPGNDNKICICEGFATGASIAEATGYKVIIAFNAGNLPKVSELIRLKNPDKDIIICGDNDENKTGEKYGRKASEAIQAGFIMPDIVGYDFNELHKNNGLQAVRDCICPELKPKKIWAETKEKKEVPIDILKPPGILSDMAKFYNKSARKKQPLFAVHAALSLSSVITARNYKTDAENYTSQNFIFLAGSGKGKEDVIKFHERILEESGLSHLIGPESYTGDAGVMSALYDQPRHICLFDEFGLKLSEMSQSGNSNTASAFRVIMVAWGKNDSILRNKGYSTATLTQKQKDDRIELTVHNPALTVAGFSQPEIFFKNINIKMAQSGFLNRFIFCNPEKTTRALSRRGSLIDVPKNIIDWCKKYGGNELLKEETVYSILTKIDNPREKAQPEIIKFHPDCYDLFDEYENYINDLADNLEKSGLDGLVGRAVESAMKISLQCALSCESEIIEPDYVKWAIAYHKYYLEAFIDEVKTLIGDSDYEQNKNDFLNAIRKAGINGITIRDASRKKPFSPVREKEREEIFKDLIAAELIEYRNTRDGKPGRSRMAYVAIEENEQ